jgi:hypothetical protein
MTPADRSPGRYSAAAHEAGHAVVAWALGLRVGELSAGTDDNEWAGRAIIEASSNLSVVDRLAVCFAGVIGQEILKTAVLDLAGFADDYEASTILDSSGIAKPKGYAIREAARKRAEALLKANTEKFEALAEALTTAGHLSSADVKAILKNAPRGLATNA